VSALDDPWGLLKAARCAHFLIGQKGPFCRLGEHLGKCRCAFFVNVGATASDLRQAVIRAAGGQIALTRPFALAKLLTEAAEGAKDIPYPDRSDR
jgi:hypothetical protein